MKCYIWIILIALFLGFCVYCVAVRSDYHNDILENEVIELEKDIKVLSYALSIVPADVKNEVFFNSIKEKFPFVEKRISLLKVIKVKKDSKEPDDKESGDKEVNDKEPTNNKKDETVISIMHNLTTIKEYN